VLPFHVQVSARNVLAPAPPPNITHSPRAASKAIAGRRRAEGRVGGFCSVHADVAGSKVRVASVCAAPCSPPNATRRPRAASHAEAP
jgi:hypothetical protein